MRRFAIIWLLIFTSALACLVWAQEVAPEQTPQVQANTASPASPTETAQPAQPTGPTTPPPAPNFSFPRRAIPASPEQGLEGRMGRSIMLDVRNLDIDNLLKLLGDAAGLTIVKDPAVQGPVTIISPQPVTIAEALEILNAVLQVRGFTAVRQGQVLKVTTLDRAVQMTLETHVGVDPDSISPGDRIITQIVPMKTLDASEVASELGPFVMSDSSLIANSVTNSLYITDTANNVRRLLEIINELEKRNAAGVRVFRLKYVAADEMADLVTNVLSASGGGGGTTGGAYEQRLLPRTPTARQPGQTAPRAAATSSGGGGIQVFTDPRTNSLIVMTSPERIEMLTQFLAEFDKPVDYSSTLAVIPLQNARADDMATLLGQVLGGGGGTTTRTTPAATATRTTPRTGVTGSRTSTSGPYLQQGQQTQDNNGMIQASAEIQGGEVVLAQSAGEASVGRTGEGVVVPLLDMTGVTIVPDNSTNSLIVNAPPEKLEQIKALVAQMDVVPAQVLIQAIVAEVTLSRETQLGVEFSDGIASTDFGLHSVTSGKWTPLQGGLNWLIVKPPNFKSLLNMLKTDSDVNILSTPRVFTNSGKKGTIDVSTQVPFAKGQFVSDTGGISTSFDYQSVGIILEVTPLMGQDGTVTMEVSQTADDLLRFEQLTKDLKLPVVAHREAVATVSVLDGDTVVLGGLISNRETHTKTGIPILKDLPLIGGLFRSTDTQKEKTELLVFLTPHVVRNAEEARMLSAQEQTNLKHLPAGTTICPPIEENKETK